VKNTDSAQKVRDYGVTVLLRENTTHGAAHRLRPTDYFKMSFATIASTELS
jgi:hypothetical protein